MNRILCGALLSCIAVAGGCSTEKKADAAQPAVLKEGSVPPRPSVVAVPSQPYRPITVTGGARLTGTIDFEGPIPADSVITLPVDQPGCGPTLTDRAVERTGTRIGGVVVWLTDIRAGKPLPVERRFELRNEDCLLSPRVQTVIGPGTLNIASEDVAMHRNRIVNVGTGEMEAIAPFNDNGEVIPFDRLLEKPAELEITCDLHPWSKAWILVLDHPYFTVSAKTGAFSIDDVPPGTYKVKAWHPRLGVAEQSVTFAPAQAATVALKLAAPVAPPTPADTSANGN
jgi:hypothetical protein